MDYDDNDLQCRNLQLAGEERSKSSSALAPYAFPKFDFDDNLQGQLRFDSLVETEVFLDIQSQEDNQWIEDFSRSRNGIEFDSGATDSCSISRHNNVWSEATSSESVEMLLKSVGQEEKMPVESIVPESNAYNEQSDISKEREPNCKQDERNVPVTNSGDALLQGEFEGNVEALPQVEGTSQTQETMISAQENSGNVQCNVSVEECVPSATEGLSSFGSECKDKVCGKDTVSVDESLYFNASEDSYATGLVDNGSSSVGMMAGSKPSQQVGHLDSLGGLRKDINDGGDGDNVSHGLVQGNVKSFEGNTGEPGTYLKDSSFHFAQVSEPLDKGNLVESSPACSKEHVSCSKESELQIQEDKSTAQLGEDETKVPPFDRDISHLDEGSNHTESPIVCVERHALVAGALVAQPEQKNESAPRGLDGDKGEGVQEDSHRRDRELSVGISESALHSSEENKSSVDQLGDMSSDLALASAAEPSMQNNQSDSTECQHDDSRVNVAESHVSTTVVDNSGLVCEEMVASGQAGACENEQDVKSMKEGDAHCPGKNTDMSSDSVEGLASKQRIGSSTGGKSTIANETIAYGLKPQTTDMESVNNVYPSGKSSESAMVDGDPRDGLREPSGKEMSHLAEQRDIGTRIHTDTHLSSLKDSTDSRMQLDTPSKVEVSVSNDTDRNSPSDMGAEPLQTERTNAVSSQEGPAVVAGSSSEQCSAKIEVQPDRSASTSEENAAAAGETELVQAADADKAACGSPTIISSSEPSRGNHDKIRGSDVAERFGKVVYSTSEDTKQKDAPADDGSFTFKVNSLPESSEGEHGKSWSPFPIVEACKSPPVVEGSQLLSTHKSHHKLLEETSRESPGVSGGELSPGTSKITSERKGRRVSARGTPKESAKKRNQVKDTGSQKASGKGIKASNASLISPGSSQHGRFPEMQHGRSEQNNPELSHSSIPVSNLSDLNMPSVSNSASPSAAFPQPFTDLQQVQLRAQIFVYGSLIQGTAPDEACMLSAFGPSDGARSMWEPVWRVAIERVRSQKSNSSGAETPAQHSLSASVVPDTSGKQSLLQSKVIASPLGRASGKGTPAAIVNPIIPLSSPLWSASTPARDILPSSGMQKGPVIDYQRAVSPLRPFQSPGIKNFVGHAAWPPQATFPSPWVTSPQTPAFNSGVCFSTTPLIETVKLTPIKDSSTPSISGLKHVTPSPVVHVTGPSSVFAGGPALSDSKKGGVLSPEHHSTDSKPRKRKKVPVSDLSQVPVVSQAQTEHLVVSSAAAVASPLVTTTTSVVPVSSSDLSNSAVDLSSIRSMEQSTRGNLDTGKAAMCSDEMLSKVAEAKVQAEDASALAAAAVSQSQDLWSQMAEKKESGLTSEVEANLASAAAAVAAAVSVAKAAAAAAKVASCAALQAKLMADEAFSSIKTGNLTQNSGVTAEMSNVGKATPASILKGNIGASQPSSILVAAKEAAKRRVEAASAAAKQAENLDAIVKAAGLAAEAVSHAGKLVAMGDPLLLSDLIEAGPEGYWKLSQSSHELAAISSKDGERAGGEADEGPRTSVNVSADGLPDNRSTQSAKEASGQIPEDMPDVSLGDHAKLVDGTLGSSACIDKDSSGQKGRKAPEMTKSIEMLPGPETVSRRSGGAGENDVPVDTLPESSIKEGSLVEVFKSDGGLKSAWYSASVLNIENGKAYLSYTSLPSDEGGGYLKEWVALEREGDNMPLIRTAHPLTALQYQGTRKRRRAAMGNYSWATGDKVDAWIDDCFWEGVITGKDEKDETSVTVQFPAQGGSRVVKAWNLRPSRLWNDGKWVEWTSLRDHDSVQGDTPHGKRPKPGSSPPGKPEEPKLLPLSASHKVFEVGKYTKGENTNRDARKAAKTGLAKEGSRVVFGVPKPTGKKRKFMEVSKQFPANKNNSKSTEGNDSVKFAKYLMPRGWKNPPKIDSKEKQAAESKSKIPYSRRPHSASARSSDNSVNSSLAPRDVSVGARGTRVDDSVVHGESTSKKQNLIELGSSSGAEEPAEGPLSSLLGHTLDTASRKFSSLSARSERLNKGKLAPSTGKLSKIEEDKVDSGNSSKPVSEAVEPRRSNRRIQPTHRLLEGLQSSLLISKMPVVSQEKGHKTQPRSSSTRGK